MHDRSHFSSVLSSLVVCGVKDELVRIDSEVFARPVPFTALNDYNKPTGLSRVFG
jgi:hypothetical protein